MPGPVDCKVYVGDLESTASRQDVEDSFSYYGRLTNVWVARNPPGFAFVEFEDARDAEDAIRGLDGRSICGRKVRVELSNGRNRSRNDGPPARSGGSFHPDDKCYECGERGHYARDCRLYSRGRKNRSRSPSRGRQQSFARGSRRPARRSYSRSRSPRRSRDHSRSRSRGRNDSRSRGRNDSRSRGSRRMSRSASRSNSREKRISRSYSRSPSRGKRASRSNSRSVSRHRSPVGNGS